MQERLEEQGLGTAGGQRAQSPASHWVCCRFDCGGLGGWGGLCFPVLGAPPSSWQHPSLSHLSPQASPCLPQTDRSPSCPQGGAPVNRDTQARCVGGSLHLAFLSRKVRGSVSHCMLSLEQHMVTHGDPCPPRGRVRLRDSSSEAPGATGRVAVLGARPLNVKQWVVINPRNHGPHNSCISRHLWGWGEPLG